MSVQFNEIVKRLNGKYVNFYGVDNNCFKIGNVVFEAVEDKSDGYRSYLDSVVVKNSDGLIFNGEPIASVKIKAHNTESFSGFVFVDVAAQTWLKIGTDNYDDYYPCFTFEYTPHNPYKDIISAILEN